MDVQSFNARWLKAWSDKDVPELLRLYADDVAYYDPQVPGGLRGGEALGAYLTQLFAATPAIEYRPHEVWETPQGFCGRWYAHVDGAAEPAMRGFDLVVMAGGRIALNEVYVHTLGAPAAG